MTERLNVLVACERSGRVRDAFLALGHFAVSCDIEPDISGCKHTAEEMHYQGDIADLLREPWRMLLGGERDCGRWDLLIAHPPCTYLTNSAEWAYKDGPHHMKLKPGTLTGAARREARAAAGEFFMMLANADVPRICIENPIGVMSSTWRKPDQIVQPYQFGENASKATCLWLKGLAPLLLTCFVEPRYCNGRPRWANQTDSGQNRLSPSEDRAHRRAETYAGIAAAMAAQWGGKVDGI